MLNRDLESIHANILSSYKSLDNPEFHFVGKAMEDNVYSRVVDQLSSSFSIDDQTDENVDVSFFYDLRSSEGEWVLRLSMVGSYAMLLRIERGGKAKIVSGEGVVLPAEKNIISILEGNGVELLDQQALKMPLRIKLFNTAREDAKIYQAMFSDTDVLPWEQVFPR